MEVIASFGGADVTVPLDAECRTMAAFKETLQAALPKLDVEKMCLEVGGRPLDEDTLLGLEDGSVVELSATPAAAATDTLREEGGVGGPVAFVHAVRSGDTRLCGLYLDHGVAWEHIYSPLYTAADNGNVDTCKLLLDRGCDIEARAAGQYATALHIATSKGHVDICKLLLDRGCDIDATAAVHNATALHIAASRGHVDICKLLLDRGCAKDAMSTLEDKLTMGGAPLHYAVAKGRVEVCRLLLDRGCDKDARDKSLMTPLHVAVCSNKVEIVELLLERGCDKDARTSNDVAPVHYAASAGHTEMCRLLIAYGCAADATTERGKTPLSLSSAKGHTEVNRLLAEHLRGSKAKGRCAQCIVA